MEERRNMEIQQRRFGASGMNRIREIREDKLVRKCCRDNGTSNQRGKSHTGDWGPRARHCLAPSVIQYTADLVYFFFF